MTTRICVLQQLVVVLQLLTDPWSWDKEGGEPASPAGDQPRKPASSRACNCRSLYVRRLAEHTNISTLYNHTDLYQHPT